MHKVNLTKSSILLADDDVAFRTSLQAFLEPHFSIVGSVGDGLAMVEAAQLLKPDVVVSDISMPVLNGIRAVRQLMSSQPDARVIFLTVHDERAFVTEARKSGALGYLLKHSAADHLIAAIHEVLEGHVFICPALLCDSPPLRVGYCTSLLTFARFWTGCRLALCQR